MSDRQQELRRQYELMQAHLAWLEKEIDRESAKSPAPAPVPSVKVATHAPAPSLPIPLQDAEALIENYAAEERHNPDAVKRGCLLAFGTTLGMLILIVIAAYFVFYAHR